VTGLKRLVYAPRAYAFIRSRNLTDYYGRNHIIDVSRDIVGGTVTRNDAGPSYANLTLRNRKRKYTRHAASKRPLFLPMDMISIFLQRIAGKPIQVFTGYLDASPYWQIYPGLCEVRATCTLKRLAYKYFDPGLPFFQSFIRERGWLYSPDGTAFNPASIPGALTGKASDDPNRDGGFGQLLYEFMTKVAGWKPDNVLVSSLPEKLMGHLAEVIQQSEASGGLLDSVQTDIEDLKFYLEAMTTIDATPEDLENAQAPMREAFQITQDLKQVAGKYKIPPILLVYAACALSGYYAKYSNDAVESDSSAGYGLFAIRPDVGGVGTDALAAGGIVYIDGVATPKTTLFNTKSAAEIVCKWIEEKREIVEPKLKLIRRGQLGPLNEVAETFIGKRKFSLSAEQQERILTVAKGYLTGLESNSNTNFDETIPTPNGSLRPVAWGSDELDSVLDAGEAQTAHKYEVVAKSDARVSTVLYWIKDRFPEMTLLNPITTDTRGLYLVDSEDGHKTAAKLFEQLKGQHDLQKVLFRKSKKRYLSAVLGFPNGESSEIPEGFNGPLGEGAIYLQVKENATLQSWTTGAPVIGEVEDGAINEVTGRDVTFMDISRIAANAAFAGSFAFPTNMMESLTLTGQKSLMNDMSCLDAISQFCQASLRSFMSMPDGRFCAFYPDYFGAHGRGPYWWISDLEITNMGIQLNDERLATHVYTPGSTMSVAQDSSVPFDRIFSLGAATIFMKDIVKMFIAPGLLGSDQENADGNKAGKTEDDPFDPIEFVNHFGARVHVQEAALIKNPLFEFLMAVQTFMTLWAETFATQVEFTFQPEVMAGGLIGFPEHGIQMYVKSVTHEFNYSGGFNTSAEMIAPAIMEGENRAEAMRDFPGFALAGAMTISGAG
jgi:hypothetical protein